MKAKSFIREDGSYDPVLYQEAMTREIPNSSIARSKNRAMRFIEDIRENKGVYNLSPMCCCCKKTTLVPTDIANIRDTGLCRSCELNRKLERRV